MVLFKALEIICVLIAILIYKPPSTRIKAPASEESMSTTPPLYRIAQRGSAILANPRWNKGTAFTLEERKAFGLTGRLPCRVNTLDEQCERALDQLQSRETPIRKNSFLQSLKEQNWVLYYSFLQRHLRELIPIIYTPTEVSCGTYSTPRPFPRMIVTADSMIGLYIIIGRCYRQLLPSVS